MQTVHELGALVLVEVCDHLGVAARGEPVPRALKAGAQLPVVVDLTVEDDRDRPVLVENWLVAGRQVDHTQTLDPKADAGVDVKPTRIRPAMLECRAHALEHGTLCGLAVTPRLSCDPAHVLLAAAV